MGLCDGYLVVHTDGTPFYCNQETIGRTCNDYSLERHRVVKQCQTIVGHRYCSYCALAGILGNLPQSHHAAV